MNNHKKSGNKQPQRRSASNSFGDLVQQALKGSPNAMKAYEQLRTTYLKEVELKGKPKKQYWKIFPDSILRVDERVAWHDNEQERERQRDFRFSVNSKAITFVRNLWFAHRFFSKPSEVEQFLTTTRPEERTKRFEKRSEQLKVLAGEYTGWLKTANCICSMLENFEPTKTDLLAVLEKTADSLEATTSTPTPPTPTPQGSAAVADLIREVEQRASYQAGNPEDACEKALYFLALGHPDIGEAIASDVLAENPDHSIALYTNAVLLLDASERHRRQAFIHDVMHPQGLPPLDAEEFYHAEGHAEESLQAWEKESQAFLLILKARQNWPKQFSIKCYELSPSMWQHKVEEWILRQAAARLREKSSGLSLPKHEDDEAALKALRCFMADIWGARGGWFLPFRADLLPYFVIVAAHVNADVARDCLGKLEAALDQPKLEETKFLWRDIELVLPVSHEPSLAEGLIPAVTDSRFCRAVFSARPTMDAVSLLRRVMQTGRSDERDRRTAMESLAMRAVVLDMAQAGDLAQATRLCGEMADHGDWPSTETGQKLQACWRYAVVLLLFDSARAAFETNDIPTAAKQACLALERATDSLEAIAGDKPLLKFIEEDDYGVTETVGDFLCRQSNIVTDTNPLDFFPPATPSTLRQLGHKPCWDDFMKWSEAELRGGKSPLLTYGLWLAQQHGQRELLLPQCEAFASALNSLTAK